MSKPTIIESTSPLHLIGVEMRRVDRGSDLIPSFDPDRLVPADLSEMIPFGTFAHPDGQTELPLPVEVLNAIVASTGGPFAFAVEWPNVKAYVRFEVTP